METSLTYGFSVDKAAGVKNSFILKLKALESRTITVSLGESKARARILIKGKLADLERVFVKTSSGLFPGVEYVALSGTDSNTGQVIKEVIR